MRHPLRPPVYSLSQSAALSQPHPIQKGQQAAIRSTAVPHSVKHQPIKQSAKRSKLPMLPGFALAPHSDSGLLGDSKTTAASVDLFGLTSPNARVTLENTSLATTADAAGKFIFTNIPLASGTASFTAIAKIGLSTRRFTASIERVIADTPDAVLTWNATTLRTIQAESLGGLSAARTLAITHLAIDAAASTLLSNTRSPTTPEASASAAVAGAAHQVLSQLYPRQKSRLDAALSASLAALSETEPIKSASVTVGQTIANDILAARSNDGANLTLPYTPKIKPGQWRPTPPNFSAAAGVGWRQVTPFVLKQAAQFRPAAPPQLTSRTYARELNQVKQLGQIDSNHRTSEQTQITRFWIGSAGTSTFPGMWNEIAAQAANQTGKSLLQNARLFAQLNLALVDASIAAWDTKYTYRSWRPVTAIRLAGSDDNAATRANPSWQSFLETPAHPDYVSAHSTFAGAAATVLSHSFGNYQFTATSSDLPGIRRSFEAFGEAAAEAGMSRIYGGIHTMAANRVGIRLGKKVANYVLQVMQ
jgi:hypothetical protein